MQREVLENAWFRKVSGRFPEDFPEEQKHIRRHRRQKRRRKFRKISGRFPEDSRKSNPRQPPPGQQGLEIEKNMPRQRASKCPNNATAKKRRFRKVSGRSPEDFPEEGISIMRVHKDFGKPSHRQGFSKPNRLVSADPH